MAILIPSHARPSWQSGFARSAAESASPEMWKGLCAAWVSELGPTNILLPDVTGRGNDCTEINITAPTLTYDGGRLALDILASTQDQLRHPVPCENVSAFCCAVWIKGGSVGGNFIGRWDTPQQHFLRADSGGQWFVRNAANTGEANCISPSPIDNLTEWTLQVLICDGAKMQQHQVTSTGLSSGTPRNFAGPYIPPGIASYWTIGRPRLPPATWKTSGLYYWDTLQPLDTFRKLYRDRLAPFRRRLTIPAPLKSVAPPSFDFTPHPNEIAAWVPTVTGDSEAI